LLLKRIYSNTNLQDWIPTHQFGFRRAHSTIQQCHRIADTINKAHEENKYCSAVFLDVCQAFDKVWHPGLLYKIKQTWPPEYLNILKSYLRDRYFSVSLNNKTSTLIPMLSGVPQGSILGPLLYTLYTADLPQTDKTILSTFADDTAIFTTTPDPAQNSANLQDHLLKNTNWTRKWKLEINESKSSYIMFSVSTQCRYCSRYIQPTSHKQTKQFSALLQTIRPYLQPPQTRRRTQRTCKTTYSRLPTGRGNRN